MLPKNPPTTSKTYRVSTVCNLFGGSTTNPDPTTYGQCYPGDEYSQYSAVIDTYANGEGAAPLYFVYTKTDGSKSQPQAVLMNGMTSNIGAPILLSDRATARGNRSPQERSNFALCTLSQDQQTLGCQENSADQYVIYTLVDAPPQQPVALKQVIAKGDC